VVAGFRGTTVMPCSQGKLKAIGVSNYNESHLKELAANARIQPMVNQGKGGAVTSFFLSHL